VTKLTVRRILSNPKKKRAKRIRQRRKRVRVVYPRTYIIEGFEDKKSRARFLFWTGRKFSASRAKAKKYRTEKVANIEARKIIRRQPPTIRFVRVVPA